MPKIIVTARAAVFDMDGVITDTMPQHYLAWKHAFTTEGLAVSEREIYLREGQKGILFLKEYLPANGAGGDPGLVRRLLRRKEERFRAIARPKLFPGAASLLRRLAGRIRLALVTGTSREEIPTMLPEKIRSLFDVIVTGSDVTRGKPDPQPYRKALRLLKVRPCLALAVENAPLGIRSAKGAGIPCFAVQSYLARKHLKEADRIFPSLQALNEQVEFRPPSQKRGKVV